VKTSSRQRNSKPRDTGEKTVAFPFGHNAIATGLGKSLGANLRVGAGRSRCGFDTVSSGVLNAVLVHHPSRSSIKKRDVKPSRKVTVHKPYVRRFTNTRQLTRSRRQAVPFPPIVQPVVKASSFKPAPFDTLPNETHRPIPWRPDRPRRTRRRLQGERDEQRPRTVADSGPSPDTIRLRPGESIVYDTPRNWRPGNSVHGLRWHVSVAGSYVQPVSVAPEKPRCPFCLAYLCVGHSRRELILRGYPVGAISPT